MQSPLLILFESPPQVTGGCDFSCRITDVQQPSSHLVCFPLSFSFPHSSDENVILSSKILCSSFAVISSFFFALFLLSPLYRHYKLRCLLVTEMSSVACPPIPAAPVRSSLIFHPLYSAIPPFLYRNFNLFSSFYSFAHVYMYTYTYTNTCMHTHIHTRA